MFLGLFLISLWGGSNRAFGSVLIALLHDTLLHERAGIRGVFPRREQIFVRLILVMLWVEYLLKIDSLPIIR